MALGTLLLDRGLLTREQFELALAEQRASGERLHQTLIRLGMITPERVTQVIAEQFDMPLVDLASMAPDEPVLQAIPAQVVFRLRCVPIGVRETGGRTTIRIATADPFDLASLDELGPLTGCSIELALADERDLREFINRHYGVAGDTLDAMARSAGATGTIEAKESSDDDIEKAHEASVIKLVNDLLLEAIASRATDVHIEPYENRLIVRYRIDGMLQRAQIPPAISQFAAAIVSRIKIMANLNIAEKRRPQDGRISLRAKGETFDLRVSIIPMLFGEGVVLRVLNKATALMSLNDLGMPETVLNRWDALISRPHGILLVTGPTGSGKSTTLYASLNRIVNEEIKAITIEDPVEYHVQGVNQIQVNHKLGLDFAAGLRAVLRHDPDVILIGEIRDKETAEAAVQASLTGHLVFSTLHTNDSASAMPRLLDMGVEPYLVASSIEGVLAQRLVRRICPNCAEDYTPEAGEVPPDLTLPTTPMRRGAGCRSCLNTGYRGRIGVYELLRLTDTLREMVMKQANAGQLVRTAQDEDAITSLRADGFAKAMAGQTTIAEVLRVATV